jgi:hypothetical protein
MKKYTLLPAFAIIAALAACKEEKEVAVVDPFAGKSFLNCAGAAKITLNEGGSVTFQSDEEVPATSWAKVEGDDKAVEIFATDQSLSTERVKLTLDEEGSLNFTAGGRAFTCVAAPEETS